MHWRILHESSEPWLHPEILSCASAKSDRNKKTSQEVEELFLCDMLHFALVGVNVSIESAELRIGVAWPHSKQNFDEREVGTGQLVEIQSNDANFCIGAELPQ